MTAELQRAQDMLSAMQQQRDQALNANVSLLAVLAAKDREITEKNAQIVELKQQIAERQAGNTKRVTGT